MSEVAQIRSELIEMYGRVRGYAGDSARVEFALSTLDALMRRQGELAMQHEKLGEMDVRARAWHLGETEAVNEMIARKLAAARRDKLGGTP